MSIFNNKSILAWLQYFSENTDIDLATVRILDITGSDRNLMPAVHANPSVTATTPKCFTTCGTRVWATVRFGIMKAPSQPDP